MAPAMAENGSDVRAADAAHRAGAAVLLVVGVQNEQDVERVLEHGARSGTAAPGRLNSMLRKLPG